MFTNHLQKMDKLIKDLKKKQNSLYMGEISYWRELTLCTYKTRPTL